MITLVEDTIFNKIKKKKITHMKKAVVIGSGFSGLSAACYLGKSGYEVTVLEKNESAGGRARIFKDKGYTFDMGPSWYWMPDVFESVYRDFNKTTSNFYQLVRLDPSYRVFAKDFYEDLPGDIDKLAEMFEKHEKGAGENLKSFLKNAKTKYESAMNGLVYKPSLSWFEFINKETISKFMSYSLLTDFSKYVRKYFKNPFLIQLIEFPVLFLGAKPSQIPSLYSLMNYADMALGTWYPMGGMSKITDALVSIAQQYNVKFEFNCEVLSLVTERNSVKQIICADKTFEADVVIGACDYHHLDQKIIEKSLRSYSSGYWDKRTMAPSSIIYYLGVNKKIKNLQHHNLFFESDFNKHASEIYDEPQWPSDPLFYVCCPSKTDFSVAPEGKENLFILIPVAAGIKENNEILEKYFKTVLKRLEERTGENILDYIEVKRSYAFSNFVSDYNSFKGNAYGLANTLNQTAVLKPSVKSKKIDNLFYAGQLTVPGPGVPPALISGKISAQLSINYLKYKP